MIKPSSYWVIFGNPQPKSLAVEEAIELYGLTPSFEEGIQLLLGSFPKADVWKSCEKW